MNNSTTTEATNPGVEAQAATDTSRLPLEVRLLGILHRVVYKVSGGRLGTLNRGRQTPTGWRLRLLTATHRQLYRLTGGRMGKRVIGLPNFLLTTTGRKTGLARTVPLPYFEHPEGFMVVASFAGNPNNPAWYENLVANPNVEVQMGSRRFRATATPASADERPALWQRVITEAPLYADYQPLTTRVIPLVIIRPQGG
jgi:deazaflavin-dependent oxidoreductase (nitroreductase family)